MVFWFFCIYSCWCCSFLSLFRLFLVTVTGQVGLEFHNQFRYYIANTLMPSLMQVVICFTTLLYHITDFQVSVMLCISRSHYSYNSLTVSNFQENDSNDINGKMAGLGEY